jgi:hypothetical protein
LLRATRRLPPSSDNSRAVRSTLSASASRVTARSRARWLALADSIERTARLLSELGGNRRVARSKAAS